MEMARSWFASCIGSNYKLLDTDVDWEEGVIYIRDRTDHRYDWSFAPIQCAEPATPSNKEVLRSLSGRHSLPEKPLIREQIFWYTINLAKLVLMEHKELTRDEKVMIIACETLLRQPKLSYIHGISHEEQKHYPYHAKCIAKAHQFLRLRKPIPGNEGIVSVDSLHSMERIAVSEACLQALNVLLNSQKRGQKQILAYFNKIKEFYTRNTENSVLSDTYFSTIFITFGLSNLIKRVNAYKFLTNPHILFHFLLPQVLDQDIIQEGRQKAVNAVTARSSSSPS